MLTKHSFRLFSAGERQVLWLPARQRGECVRCFHASLQRPDKHELAGAGASRQETQQKKSPEANVVERVQARSGPPDSFSAASPHQPTKPATSQDRRRHQRSAMISEEVKMVQRDHPSPSFAHVNPSKSPQQPPPTAQTPNPEVGVMGENDPVSREGPTGQGVGRPVAADEDVQDTSGLARGARSPHEGVEEPVAGGTAVAGAVRGDKLAMPSVGEDDGADAVPGQPRRRARLVDVVEPSRTVSKEDLLNAGYETSTPTHGNMHRNLVDHIRMSAHPAQQSQTSRNPAQLAVKMMDGQFVHFESHAEKAAAEEFARKIAERRAKNYAQQQRLSTDATQPEAMNYHFAPMSESMRKSVIDRLGRGAYDAEGLLSGQALPKYKAQPLLNSLAQQALKNATYTTQDGDRFIRKVQSLLPRNALVEGQRQGRRQKARAKVA